jgi:hypothetical protein
VKSPEVDVPLGNHLLLLLLLEMDFGETINHYVRCGATVRWLGRP